MHDAGKEVPAIRDKPSLVGYEWLWRAYNDLATCRQYGMGPGPIPWYAIQAYAESLGLDTDETYILHRAVRIADTVWLENRATMAAQQQKTPDTPLGSPSRGRTGR